MTIKNLTLEDVCIAVQSICADYGDFLTMDCVDEVVETFYNQWDFVNEFHKSPSFLYGLTKQEAYFYYDIVDFTAKNFIQKCLADSEQVPNFV